MSGAAVMLLGANCWMKVKTLPKTKKYEKATPMKNSSVLETITGSASMKAASIVTLMGTMNGEIGLVAIIVAPAGRCWISGMASQSYRPEGEGEMARATKAMAMAMTARIRRSRSS